MHSVKSTHNSRVAHAKKAHLHAGACGKLRKTVTLLMQRARARAAVHREQVGQPSVSIENHALPVKTKPSYFLGRGTVTPPLLAQLLNTWVADDADAAEFLKTERSVWEDVQGLYIIKAPVSICKVTYFYSRLAASRNFKPRPLVRAFAAGCAHCNRHMPDFLTPHVRRIDLSLLLDWGDRCLQLEHDYNPPPVSPDAEVPKRRVYMTTENFDDYFADVETDHFKTHVEKIKGVSWLVFHHYFMNAFYESACVAVRAFSSTLLSIELRAHYEEEVSRNVLSYTFEQLVPHILMCPQLVCIRTNCCYFSDAYVRTPVQRMFARNMKNELELALLPTGTMPWYYGRSDEKYYEGPIWKYMPFLKSLQTIVDERLFESLLGVRCLQNLTLFSSLEPKKHVTALLGLAKITWLRYFSIAMAELCEDAVKVLLGSFSDFKNLDHLEFSLHPGKKQTGAPTWDFVADALRRIPCKRIVIYTDTPIETEDPRVEQLPLETSEPDVEYIQKGDLISVSDWRPVRALVGYNRVNKTLV